MLVYLSEYIHPDAVKLLKQHGEITDTFDRIRKLTPSYSAQLT